jgi:invasion protein IalB
MKARFETIALPLSLCVAALVTAVSPANGKEAAAAAALPAPAPEVTTAKYGDWMVVCVGSGATQRCEGLHSLKNTQGQAVAVLAVGYPGKGQPLRMSLRVPVSVTVAAPATVTIGSTDPIPLPFGICIPQGCFADVPLASPEAIARLRGVAVSTPVTARWQDAGTNKIELPVSFKGLPSVFDRLQELDR